MDHTAQAVGTFALFDYGSEAGVPKENMLTIVSGG